ncbi:MAG: hypothetical protein ABFS14_11770 [Gemmatimonadota bacterium]
MRGWRDDVMRIVVITLAVLTLWGSAGARVLLECPLHEDTAADPAAHATSDHAASDQAAEPAEHGGSPASEHEDHDCQCGYDCCLSGAAALAEAGSDAMRWDPVPAPAIAAAAERPPFSLLDPWFLPPANGPPVG